MQVVIDVDRWMWVCQFFRLSSLIREIVGSWSNSMTGSLRRCHHHHHQQHKICWTLSTLSSVMSSTSKCSARFCSDTFTQSLSVSLCQLLLDMSWYVLILCQLVLDNISRTSICWMCHEWLLCHAAWQHWSDVHRHLKHLFQGWVHFFSRYPQNTGQNY